MNASILKSQIRDNIRGKRILMSENECQKAANILKDAVMKSGDPEVINIIASARCIALYRAVRGELSCEGVADYLSGLNKVLCYPRVKGDSMDFYEINDRDKQFTLGAYDIPEPKSECKKIFPEDIDVIFVPAVAYTEDGMLLGQGGGYYDRYLNAYGSGKKPITIGVCYDYQIYSALPVEKHDYAVDYILCVDMRGIE